MKTKHLLSINPYPLTAEEFRKEIIAGLLIPLKKPFGTCPVGKEVAKQGTGVRA